MVEMLEPEQVIDFRGQIHRDPDDPRADKGLSGRDVAIKRWSKI